MYSQMNFTLFAQLLLIVNLLRLVLPKRKRIQSRLSKVINYTQSRLLACIFMVYKRQIVRANNVLRPTILLLHLLLHLLASITHPSFIYTAPTKEFSISETVHDWLNRPSFTCLMVAASRPCIWKERKQQRVAVSLWLTNEQVIKTSEFQASNTNNEIKRRAKQTKNQTNERTNERKKRENETTKEKLDSANERAKKRKTKQRTRN